jgi:hypothetical protein
MFQTRVVEREREKTYILCPIHFLANLTVYKQLKKINLYAVEAKTELIHKNCYAMHTFPNPIILREI